MKNQNINKNHIRCINCKFTRKDPDAPGNGLMTVKNKYTGEKTTVEWYGIECGNCHSEYYKALLNVSINGDRQMSVTWSGCEYGERREEE